MNDMGGLERDGAVRYGRADVRVKGPERSSRELRITDPTQLYDALSSQLEIRAFQQISVPLQRDGPRITMRLKDVSTTVVLVAQWKKDAPRVIYSPPMAYVPSSLGISPRDKGVLDAVRDGNKAVVDYVTKSVILDAKADFLRKQGSLRDKMIAEKLALQAHQAFIQANLAQFGLRMNSASLSWDERVGAEKAHLFWESLIFELEQRVHDRRPVTSEDVNALISQLREELNIGREKSALVEGSNTDDKPNKRQGPRLGVPVITPLIPNSVDAAQKVAYSQHELGQTVVDYSLLLLTLVSGASGVVACSTQKQPETPPTGAIDVTDAATAVSTLTATSEPLVGIISTPTDVAPARSTSTPEVGKSTVWVPPTLEQDKAGLGGAVPADVQAEMNDYETKANGKIPGAAKLESRWNEGDGNDSRIVTFARDKDGNILWSTSSNGGTTSFNEYPIYWTYDAQKNKKIVDNQTFDVIPDSKDAFVVFTGATGATGNGEKPALVKDVVALPDGTQVFMHYWNRLTGKWEVNPNLPDEIKNMPDGATGRDADGNWTRTVTENGGPVVETWRTIPTGDNGETMTGWFGDHVIGAQYNGGMPAIDQEADGYGQRISIHFEVKDGIDAPFIHHTSSLGSSTSLDFTRLLFTRLLERYYKKPFTNITDSEYTQFRADLYDSTSQNYGKLSIPVTDANGNTFNLMINDNTRINIYLVNPEDITPDLKAADMRSVTTGDNQETLTIIIADTKQVASLSDPDFADLILFSAMKAIVYQDQSQKAYENNIGLDGVVEQLVQTAIKPPNPLFEIVRP